MKLDHYEVEALDVNDKWGPVGHILGQEVYAGVDPTHLKPITGIFLDAFLEDKLLQQHDPVSGWAFFNLPFFGPFTTIRVTVRDVEGVKFVSGSLKTPTQSFQKGTLIAGDGFTDITKWGS